VVERGRFCRFQIEVTEKRIISPWQTKFELFLTASNV
jgi:hypothetical protein